MAGTTNCSVSIVPQRVDQLLNGLMANFQQIDTHKNYEIQRYFQDLLPLWKNLIKCWEKKACNDLYTKDKAEQDAEDCKDGVLDQLKEMIEELIHDAAKYRIPKILTDMERARMYESACSHMLMCDVFDDLRKIPFKDYLNNACEQKAKRIREYAAIQVDNINAATNQWDAQTRMVERYDGHIEEKHHINSDIAQEVLLLSLFFAIIALIMEKIYDHARDKDKEIVAAAMANCGGS